jgi:hypothetical protein
MAASMASTRSHAIARRPAISRLRTVFPTPGRPPNTINTTPVWQQTPKHGGSETQLTIKRALLDFRPAVGFW